MNAQAIFMQYIAPYLSVLILLGDLVLTVGIVHRVPYTEIDWEAYMSEVEGVHNGTYIYTELKGATGPLVYPAGFVWLYLGLYHLTGRGLDIRLAQYLFVALYMACIVAVFAVYRRAALPFLLVLLCASRRIHSIFVLRLFNDCFAMTFLYASVASFVADQWTLGCVLFTAATSVKMNILLFAPGLGVLLLKRFGWRGTPPRLVLCAVWQVAVAVPFLRTDAWAYVARAFDLGRQFMYVWSVNLKFLPEELFLRKELGLALLAANLVVVLAFAHFLWCRGERGGLLGLLVRMRGTGAPLPARHVAWVLFTSNFIGIVFARSLHFQFYVWYYHTLPLLLWSVQTSNTLRLLVLGAVEFVWNVYPSNERSSLLLLACHALLLFLLFTRPDASFLAAAAAAKSKKRA